MHVFMYVFMLTFFYQRDREKQSGVGRETKKEKKKEEGREIQRNVYSSPFFKWLTWGRLIGAAARNQKCNLHFSRRGQEPDHL